jgi:hypothetical protein
MQTRLRGDHAPSPAGQSPNPWGLLARAAERLRRLERREKERRAYSPTGIPP